MGDSYYHAACFTCTECGVSLSKGGKAADDGDGDAGGDRSLYDGEDGNCSDKLMMTKGDITPRCRKPFWLDPVESVQI